MNNREAEIAKWTEMLNRVRSAPDYVPEFPPSRLIDDSVEGCVNAYVSLRENDKKDR